MTPDVLISRFRKRVRERVAVTEQRVSSGRAKDWAEYRQWVGEIHGYQTALADLAEIVKHYEEEDDDDDA